MRKSTLTMLCVAAVGMLIAVTSLSGQYGQSSSANMPEKTVKLVGCLQQGSSPDVFLLTNVEEKTAMGQSGSSMGTQAGQQTGTSGGEKTGKDFLLVGNTSLKDHVGHRIEISGTVEPLKGEEATGAGTSGTSGSTAPTDRVRVKTLKMVDNSCSK